MAGARRPARGRGSGRRFGAAYRAVSVGSFTVSFRRVYGAAPLAYRATFPPAQRHIRIPGCIARAYGRPQNRTFREAETSSRP